MEEMIANSVFFLIGGFVVCVVWFLSKRIKKAVVKICSYVVEKDDFEANLLKLEKEARAITDECVELLIKKQRDYGRENIAMFGETGVIIRMNDKLQRLNKLVLRHDDPANEPLEDTYKDTINYSIIALLIRRGLW